MTMAPNTTSLTHQPIEESPKHQVVEDTDSNEDSQDGKLIPLSPLPQDKAEKEEETGDDKGEEETDSKDDDEEDEIDGKSIALLPGDKAEEETHSEDDDDEEEEEEDWKSIEPSPLDKAEEETDSEDDNEEEQIASFPPSHLLSQSIAIQNNGSYFKSDHSTASSDSGSSPSKYLTQPIPKSLNIITEKRSHAEMNQGQQSFPKRNKKPKRDDVEKKAPSPLIWGNDDEVILLRGMEKYKNDKGVDPKSVLGDFYNSIKDKFQVVCSKEQLRNKIRNLSRRFINNMNRRVNDSDPVFSKPRECLVFHISKKVWGDNKTISNGSSKMVTKDNSKNDRVKEKIVVYGEKSNGEGHSFWSKYLFLSCLFDELSVESSSVNFSKMKDKMSLIGNEVAKELNDKCKQLVIEKLDLKRKMADLMRDVLKRD